MTTIDTKINVNPEQVWGATLKGKPENDPTAVAKYSTYLRRFTFGPLMTQPGSLSLEDLAIHTLAMIHLKNGRTPLRFGAFLAALDGLLDRDPPGLAEVREEIRAWQDRRTDALAKVTNRLDPDFDRIDQHFRSPLQLLRWFERILVVAAEGKPIPAGPSDA